MSPAPTKASIFSNADVKALAAKAEVQAMKLAPGWQWFYKRKDGTKVMIGATNALAYEALLAMVPKPAAQPTKDRKLWTGDELFVISDQQAASLGLDPKLAKVFGCAPSRAALVRMIHAYRGYEFPSIDYRVKKHWTTRWEPAMAGIVPEPGLWVVRAPGEKPVRLV